MKICSFVLLLLFTANFCFANVWLGDYLVQSQADADAFTSVCNCTLIEGNLTISGNDIVHISHFRNLKTVGLLETYMTNFESLENIHTLKINEDLFSNETLSGFSKVKKIGNLQIGNNDKIKYIDGFDALEEATYIEIYNNPNLEEITGFNGLKSVNSIVNEFWNCFQIINNLHYLPLPVLNN